ncbi:MAG: enoyl-CoA hydratase/isomerase family protein [Thermoplasmatota archaeon]
MSLVLEELDGTTLVLTLNRPEKRNALNAETRRDLLAALASAAERPEVRVIVITGAGKAFAAGADVAEMNARTLLEQRDFILPPHIYDAVRLLRKPVIAAVNGPALGAGCELAMACDLRVAAAGATFGQPEIRLGIIPGGGGTQRLVRLVGRGRAFLMLTTGESLSAERAAEAGLVDEVVAPEALLSRCKEIAMQIAANSPLTVALAKEAVRAAEETHLPEGLAREIDLFMLAFASEDRKEGIKAFLEKRTPQWNGK